jgi:hypothetical protein
MGLLLGARLVWSSDWGSPAPTRKNLPVLRNYSYSSRVLRTYKRCCTRNAHDVPPIVIQQIPRAGEPGIIIEGINENIDSSLQQRQKTCVCRLDFHTNITTYGTLMVSTPKSHLFNPFDFLVMQRARLLFQRLSSGNLKYSLLPQGKSFRNRRLVIC